MDLRALRPIPLALALPLLACSAPNGSSPQSDAASASTVGDLPTIAEHTQGLERVDGFLPLYWDGAEGQLLLEVPPAEQEVLHYVSLPTGLGSNDVGLDRAQLSTQHLVRFRRVGPKVLVVTPNLDWRSSSDEEPVARGVEESFAESVVFGFEPVAREGDRILVDATELFLSDAHGIADRLEGAGQGGFTLDESRSTLARDLCAGFPENTEVEALLTFTSNEPGPEVRRTAAEPTSVSFRVRHSFVALPSLLDDPYRPRAFDPRCGYFPLSWTDVSAPIDRPMTRRVIRRHHLTTDEPIVYYVDRAAPEPVRTALLEGARYWEPVFAAAGFPGGFRVELLPEGADIQDVRYNVVSWVSRSTRGWSYGNSVVDPRTGRILKGHVTLGALRVRQDVLLFEGLLSPYGEADSDPRVTAAALARIRQLSAHEIGHTLGLAHNFAASVDGRASVMDYPAPLIELLPGDRLDLSAAYRDGCGLWDELTIRYGYADFGDAGAEPAALATLLRVMQAEPYLSDSDARGSGRSHPLANLWDNGADALLALETTYRVRAIALRRLSEHALVPGRALSELERALVPLFLHHRYQLEAVVRLLGGVGYDYTVITADGPEGSPALAPVPAVIQERALELTLQSLDPAFLTLPDGLAEKLLPPPPGHRRDRESFEPGAQLVDPYAPARASAEITLALLFDAERAARLIDQAGANGPGLTTVLERVSERLHAAPGATDGLRLELQTLFVDHLMRIATLRGADARVSSQAWTYLRRLETNPQLGTWQRDRIARFVRDPEEHGPPPPQRVPPGSPIGACLGD